MAVCAESLMDIFERKETPTWRRMVEIGSRGFESPRVLEDWMVEIYRLGVNDSGNSNPEPFEFTDEAAEASLKVANTLIQFREKLIKEGSMSSGLADQLTLNHHHALFTKDFIKLSRGLDNE